MSEAIETAKMHLQNAEGWAHRDEYDRSQSAALVGIGFALIGIGEALEQPEVVQVLEANLPEAWCGETTEHGMHLWTVSEDVAASPVSPTTSLRRCRGHSGDRQRVGGPPHSRCGECNQTTGNYHLSNCSHNTVSS